MPQIDETHDPKLRSWVASANGHPDFPIQNLPLGVFSPPGGGAPRAGVAIGDMVLDLAAAHAAGPVHRRGGPRRRGRLGRGAERALRPRRRPAPGAAGAALRTARRGRAPSERRRSPACTRPRDCTLHLPARIGDYTDFYVGIHHATNVGKLFRPDNPLLPNYKYVPIGYHGRASSVVPSGTPIRRPNGQRKRPDEAAPSFGPCRNLDYELELGVWIGPGNALGEPIPIGEAAEHIAGYCLLNDWSARDIQAWEYQPLGPFLAKNFGSTVSPWVVTPEALAPFRVAQPPRPEGDPAPLPYLLDEADQARARSPSSWRCCC